MTITRILVPTDFSADADTALRYAVDLAQRFEARIHMLHVVENPLAAGMWSSEVYTTEIAGLQINLVRDSEERLRRSVPVPPAGVAITHEVRIGHPASTIVECAGELGCDLIVMGTRGRTGVSHLLMGSVAERVVRLAGCPVLTMRSPEPRQLGRAAASA